MCCLNTLRECFVEIIALSENDANSATWSAGDGSCEAVGHPTVESSTVEIVLVSQQRRETLFSVVTKTNVGHPSSEEITHVSEYDENEIIDVRGDDHDERWIAVCHLDLIGIGRSFVRSLSLSLSLSIEETMSTEQSVVLRNLFVVFGDVM